MICRAPAQGAIEQSEGLQRLTQIVTGRGEKAALAPVSPVGALTRLIGEHPRGLCGLARHDQLGLDTLAVGHIANGGSDEGSANILNGA